MASTKTATYTNSNDFLSFTAGTDGVSYIVDGLSGVDTLSMGTSVKADYFIIHSADGSVQVDTISGASSPTYLTLKNMEVVLFNNKHDYLGIGGNAVAFFDSAFFWQKNSTALTVSLTSTGYQGRASDGTGLFTFENINRIQFKDKSIALDFANNGNASLVAKTLVAVFGAPSVSNTSYVGIGLKFLDQDTHATSSAKFSDIIALALSVALPSASNAQVVDLLYTNVVGAHPTSSQAQPFVAMLETGAQTVSSLGVMAADLVNITAMGLPQAGLPYTGYTL